jgi:hypothetical protein
MIEPTPGRIVWYFPSIEEGRDPNGQPLAAMVAKVLSERSVNLTVSHGDGSTYGRQAVQLLQDDDAAPETAYACWMPYQKGQAAKHDAPAPALQLETVTKAIDELTLGTQQKFEQLGEWLRVTFAGIDQKIEAVKSAPPAPLQP